VLILEPNVKIVHINKKDEKNKKILSLAEKQKLIKKKLLSQKPADSFF
jgi:hypothetical protein